MESLTSRQAEAERFIREYAETRGYAPSFREIAAWLGVSVTGAVGHLKALRRKQRVTWDASVARSLRLVKNS